MIRILFTLSITLLLASSSFGQKVKFEKLYCSAQKCNLPVHKADPENRTYTIESKGIYSSELDPEAGRLYGWKKVDDNPQAHAVVSLYGFSYGRSNLKTQKKQKKDKDGNVTGTYTEYWYEVNSTGKGTLYIYGPKDPFQYKKKDKGEEEMTKREKEKAEAAAAAKEAEDSNPFLQGVDVEPAGDDDEGADEGAENIELELIKTQSINQTKSFKTARKRSSKEAGQLFTKNVRSAQYEFRENYPSMAFNEGVKQFNALYGFKPVKYNFVLQKIKSGDIREVDTWNNAVDAAKKIMGSLRYNTDLTQTVDDMKPIIDFFDGIMGNYSLEDKKEKKIAKAAFENMVYLQSYLDMHQENLALCNKYIDDKKLDNICKKRIKRTERTMAHLDFLGMPFRHVQSSEEEEEGEEEIEEENEVAEDDEGEK